MKLNIRNTIIFLVFGIYPIIPQYFGIMGISAFKLMCLGIVLFACVALGISKSVATSCRNIQIAFGIWLIIMFINAILFKGVVEYFYEILCYYLVGFVIIKCLNTRKRFLRAVDLLIIGAVVASIIGIVESITGFNVFHLLNNMGAQITLQPLRFGFRRIISFTYQTISFCNYCMFALGLIVYRISVCSKGNERKQKYGIAYGFVFIAALLTLSRSILICIIISQLILLYLCGYKVLLKKLLIIISVGMLAVIICSIVLPEILNILQNVAYMLLAVFDDNYAAMLGNVDGTGSGDRKELLKWVWESIDNKWIGMGGSAEFAYSLTERSGIYSYIRTKTSIENQYLNLLYHYGIIGLISMIWVYIQVFIKSIIQAVKNPSEWEGRISFPKMLVVILGTYYISFFGVHQIDEKRIFFCLIFLLIAYCNNKAYLTAYE